MQGPAFAPASVDASGGLPALSLLPSYQTQTGVTAQIRRDVGVALHNSCEHLQQWPAFHRVGAARDVVAVGSVRDVVRKWTLQYRQPLSLSGNPCLWTLWPPLAALISLQKFHLLAGCLESQRGPKPHSLLRGLDVRPGKEEAPTFGNAALPARELMTLKRFDLLGDALRRWAPCLLAHGPAAPDHVNAQGPPYFSEGSNG